MFVKVIMRQSRLKVLTLLGCCWMVAELASAQVAPGTNAALDKVVRADNALGFKLLAETRKARTDGNVFQSPLGLALALGMAGNGARGQTLEQIAATLQMPGLAPSAWNEGNQMLLGHLSGLDPKITLEIANSLWLQTDAKIKPDFVASCEKSYRAEVADVDFRNPATLKRINDWVSQNTQGKIPSIFDPPLPPDLRLVLLDAIYFKGTWETPFDKKLTRDQPFTLRGGQAVPHPRMSRKGRMNYLESTGFQAVILPYQSGQVSLCVFLPKGNLESFIMELTPENWEQWMARFRSREGTLELPRFKLENKYELNEELAALGMPRAFSRQAEFGGISDGPLFISKMVQKTFVEVNEEGTEAAAATGIAVMPSLVRREPEPPFTMIVDRPFYVAIRDNQTGAILFHGVIEDPR